MVKEQIRELALEMGFSACGFTHSDELTEEIPSFKKWINEEFHAEMHYMENHFQKRMNPSLLVENSKTVISLLLNYYPEQLQNPNTYKISKYAYGEDYHTVFKEKMRSFLDRINSEIIPVSGRIFTDSAPLLERALAVRAGLGWIGKNSLLITKDNGSFVFIGEIVIDTKLDPDEPFTKNFCGNCSACIDSCPAKAIVSRKVVDARKCLSYLTIEHRGEFDSSVPDILSDHIFGCDACQDVCPWNRKVTPTSEKRFNPHPDLLKYSKNDWENITVEEYQKIFKKGAVKRAKYSGITRNISAANTNSN